MNSCEFCAKSKNPPNHKHCRFCGLDTTNLDFKHITYHGMVKHWDELIKMGFDPQAMTELYARYRTELGM